MTLNQETPAPDTPPELLRGVLHLFVAFDWGDEIDLARAAELVPGQQPELARRRRTPSSMGYRPTPLRVALPWTRFPGLPVGYEGAANLTLFDLGAVSLRWQLPFRLSADELGALADRLADNTLIEDWARPLVAGLFEQLRPAITNPQWSPLSEEYVVFQFHPGFGVAPPAELLGPESPWLARLLRLEPAPLSADELREATRLYLRYSTRDIFVAEWGAAVLCDDDCEETLQTVELVNLQLLEYRHIDERLDSQLAEAYRAVPLLAGRWFPLWRSQARKLRALGELRVEANRLFERTGNVLKLVGDQYLARVYRLLADRFHLAAWERNIRESLDVLDRVYQVVADQGATLRAEALEITIVVLIAFEIGMALWRH